MTNSSFSHLRPRFSLHRIFPTLESLNCTGSRAERTAFFFSPIVSTSQSSSLISPSPPHNNKEEGEERRKMTFLHPGLGIWQFSSEPPEEKKGENGGQGLNLRHFDNEGPGLRPRARTMQVETEAARGGKKGNHCAYIVSFFSLAATGGD